MEQRLTVFLCHASEDKAVVREIDRRLREDGFEPWLDEKELLPGQDWSLEIKKALRRSDAIVVCLSKTSVTKEGYIQREIRRALEVAEEKPEGTVFIIPVKLEECEIPERLARWHWIAYYEEGAYDRLVAALQLRAEAMKQFRSEEYDGERSRLLRAAEGGNTDAMLYLARMYDSGTGVKQDPGAATSWYRAAAEAGDARGMNETGRRLAAGRGVARDKQEAFRWYLRAAETGSAAGMTSVGLAYRRGIGVDWSDSEAVRWLQKAADAGHAEAMAELGAMYADGAGVDKDDAVAVQWFLKAADSGAINGVRYLATMHEQGRGVPKDDRTALRLLRKAADAGDAPAMVLLGRRYLQHDHLEAKRLFEQAASALDPAGMRELANLYSREIGVAKDAEAATKLLEKAAANDDVDSMRTLGMGCEARGQPLKAIRWYRQAEAFRDEYSVARLRTLAGANPVFELVHTFVHTHERGRLEDIALSADGRFAVFCAGYAGETPSLWDAAGWKELRRIKTRKHVTRAVFSPTGRELGLYYHYSVEGEYGGSVGVFDLADDRLILDCATPGWYCHRLWFRGENLMVLESDPQGNDLLDQVSRRSGRLKKLFSGRNVLSLTPDAMLVAILAEHGSFIEIRERRTRKIRTTLGAPTSFREVLSLESTGAFSDDGKMFAAQDKESVRIWDLSSGQQVKVIPEKGRLLFSPDGSLLVIAGLDSALRLWDTKTGELRQTMGEEDSVHAFAFRPDGELLVTANDGGRMRVWEAR